MLENVGTVTHKEELFVRELMIQLSNSQNMQIMKLVRCVIGIHARIRNWRQF